MIVGTVSTDRWVATFLQSEINFALAERHAQHARPGAPDSLIIDETRLVRYQRPLGGFTPCTLPSGEPGTRCKLRGGIWVNTRSYSLFKTDGRMWLASTRQETQIVAPGVRFSCTSSSWLFCALSSRPLSPSRCGRRSFRSWTWSLVWWERETRKTSGQVIPACLKRFDRVSWIPRPHCLWEHRRRRGNSSGTPATPTPRTCTST